MDALLLVIFLCALHPATTLHNLYPPVDVASTDQWRKFDNSLRRLINDDAKRSEILTLLNSIDKPAVTKLFELSSILSEENLRSHDASLILQEFLWYSAIEHGKQLEKIAKLNESKESVPLQYRDIVHDLIAIENDSSLSERHKSQLQLNVITHLEPSVQPYFNQFLPVINETVAVSILTEQATIKEFLGATGFRDEPPEHKQFPSAPNMYSELLDNNATASASTDRRSAPHQWEPTTLHGRAPNPDYIRPVNHPQSTFDAPNRQQPFNFLQDGDTYSDADLLDSSSVNHGAPKVNVFVPRDFEFGGEVSRFSLGEEGSSKNRYVLPQLPVAPYTQSLIPTANPNHDRQSGITYRSELFPLINKKEILEERFRIDRDGRFRGLPLNAGPITAGFKEYPGQGRPLKELEPRPSATATILEKFAYESKKAQGSLKDRFVDAKQTTTPRPTALSSTTTAYGVRPYFGPERITGSLARPYPRRSVESGTRAIPYTKIDLQNK